MGIIISGPVHYAPSSRVLPGSTTISLRDLWLREHDEVAAWVNANSKIKDKTKIILWNYKMRDMRLSEMSVEAQEFLESYILENLPRHRPVYVWFDVFDLEEGRL